MILSAAIPRPQAYLQWPGRVTQRLDFYPGVITYRIGRLENKGFVTRQRRDDDRRLVHAVISRAGVKLCGRMGLVHVESVRAHFLDHVPRKDLRAIGDAFDHLYAAQHPDPAP